jgi:hypothetical protein
VCEKTGIQSWQRVCREAALPLQKHWKGFCFSRKNRVLDVWIEDCQFNEKME